jgi:hypothetical protein
VVISLLTVLDITCVSKDLVEMKTSASDGRFIRHENKSYAHEPHQTIAVGSVMLILVLKRMSQR